MIRCHFKASLNILRIKSLKSIVIVAGKDFAFIGPLTKSRLLPLAQYPYHLFLVPIMLDKGSLDFFEHSGVLHNST